MPEDPDPADPDAEFVAAFRRALAETPPPDNQRCREVARLITLGHWLRTERERQQ